jgi:hypothetical protein
VLAVGPVGEDRAHRFGLSLDADDGVAIGQQVARPGRVVRLAPVRADDDVVAAVAGVQQRLGALLPRLPAGRGDQQVRQRMPAGGGEPTPGVPLQEAVQRR